MVRIKWPGKGPMMGRTPEGTVFEVVFLVMAIAVWALIVWLISKSPDVVATHFNGKGEPNSWGSPTTVIFPCLIISVGGLCTLLCAYFPHSINMPVQAENPRQIALAMRMVRILSLLLLLLTAAIALGMLGSYVGFPFGIATTVLSVVGLIMTVCIVFTVLVWKAR
jgi:hypothetical protein